MRGREEREAPWRPGCPTTTSRWCSCRPTRAPPPGCRRTRWGCCGGTRGWRQRGAEGGCCRLTALLSSSFSFSPSQRLYHPDYNNELTQFLPRTVVLKKPPGAQVGPPRDPLILLKSPPRELRGRGVRGARSCHEQGAVAVCYGRCVPCLAAGLQHPWGEGLAAGHLHLQGVSHGCCRDWHRSCVCLPALSPRERAAWAR